MDIKLMRKRNIGYIKSWLRNNFVLMHIITDVYVILQWNGNTTKIVFNITLTRIAWIKLKTPLYNSKIIPQYFQNKSLIH